ncbi:zf-HC2 domain-containing protein [Candidatus Avelusimicrobium fimicolum]|uniref:anti-sigma factor family protein n=1 Tax=Candidatus Avelusimicrobium fimicolum TaxID=3416216 RepID=UPI0015B068F8
MNNTCEKAVLYAAGELTADEKAAFETHLKTCASCRAEVALLNKTQEALIPPAAPGVVVEELFAKTTRKKISFLAVWKTALAGTAVLGVGIFFLLATLHPDRAAFDTTEIVAYMSEHLDEDYQNFSSDLELFEEDF